MFSRAIIAFVFGCLLVVSGCCGCDSSIGQPAPAFKFCNGTRFMREVAWFYADVQDVVFGVDYNQDMHDEFPTRPY